MSKIQINTTQNVKIDFPLAGVGERILATLIDLLIFLAYFYVLGVLFDLFDFDGIKDNWSQIALIGIALLPVMLYTILLEIFFAGQTLGKKILKIRVVKIDGYRASFSDYFVRWIFRIVDIWLLGIFPIVAIISISSTKNRQRLGGISSGTAVISLKNKVNIGHTLLQEVSEEYKPVYPSVISLTDRDAQIIKNLFLSAKKRRDYSAMIKLRVKIEELLKVKKDKDMRDDRFIDIVLKDYTYYTQDMI
jgi:uncharacterized RDD family membrane protein YckC